MSEATNESTSEATESECAAMSTPAIGALAPWFGGKRTMAKRIIDTIGKHTAYWEPFCGSMAILMAKPQCTMETVNDLHGDLVNLARCVQRESLAVELFRRLYATPCSETLHSEAAERFRDRGNCPAGDDPDIDRAYDYFVCSWNGRNGVAGTSSYNQGFCRRFTKNGGHAAKRFASAVESIPDWWDRLRNVTILNGDAFELLERIEDANGVAIYCDPPYLVKGAKYVHDFAGEDHHRLAELLRRFKRTKVVVSYYDDERLEELYPGWRRENIEVTKSLVNQGMRDKGGAIKALEVLLVNEDPGLF